jgi:hypothetical protein
MKEVVQVVELAWLGILHLAQRRLALDRIVVVKLPRVKRNSHTAQ